MDNPKISAVNTSIHHEVQSDVEYTSSDSPQYSGSERKEVMGQTQGLTSNSKVGTKISIHSATAGLTD